MTPKIGVADIETVPIKANVWGLFDQNVGLNQIDTDWSILSFAVKPLGAPKSKIVYLDTRDRDDPRDDSGLLKPLWDTLNEYDFIVAQNGKRFDLRKIKARLILAGFTPPSPVKVLDTMLMARAVAAFTSNKLEYLGPKVGGVPKDAHREFPGFELWAECLKGNPKAFRALKRYNIPDIIACEATYLKLRPWYEQHPNLAVYGDSEERQCGVCLSTDVQRDGWAFTNVGRYERYVCGNCGKWSRGRYTRNTKAQRRVLLGN